MNEVLDSIGRWFREKTSSPLYATYFLSLIIINWEWFYILFWMSDNNINLPKIEYLYQFTGNISYVDHLISFLILPLFTSYLLIFIFPYITSIAHKKHLDFLFIRKASYYKKEAEYQQLKARYQAQEVRSLEEQKKLVKEKNIVKNEIKFSMTEEDQYKIDYEDFKSNSLYEKFEQIIYVIYEKFGHTHTEENFQFHRNVDTDILSYAHTNDLIEFTNRLDATEETIQLTSKGKFFVQKYSPERKKFVDELPF